MLDGSHLRIQWRY